MRCRWLAPVPLVANVIGSPALAADRKCEPSQAAEKYPAQPKSVHKIGADPQTPPSAMRDPKGFHHCIGTDGNLAKAVFGCVGIKSGFVLAACSAALPAVQSAQPDATPDELYYNTQREKVVFVATYMQYVGISPKNINNTQYISTIDKLFSLPTTSSLGSNNETAVKKQDEVCKGAGKSAVAMMPFQALSSGRGVFMDGGRAVEGGPPSQAIAEPREVRTRQFLGLAA